MQRHKFLQKINKGAPMTDIEFVHWLNGFFEVSGCNEVNPEQTKIIKDKLQALFIKETPKLQTTPPISGGFILNPNSTIAGVTYTAMNTPRQGDGVVSIFGNPMPPVASV